MNMKKYLFIAASALALASCSSEDFVGTEGGNVDNGANKAINFAGETGKTTRAADGHKVGAAAADLLGGKFYVLGTKGELPTGSPTTTKVFDNYQVEWGANTAGTTSDNTNDWKYAGLDFVALNKTTHKEGDKQTIKFWDYSVPQYDFIAYSVGKNDLVTKETDLAKDKVLGTTIVTPNVNNDNVYTSYTLKATTIDDLKECYYTDVTTVSKDKDGYKQPVKFTFKNLTAKVRIAFYETVPGYSVKDLQFYSEDNTKRGDLNSANSATLYTTGTDKYIAKNGEIVITYPVVGSNAQQTGTKGYNKAIVSVNSKNGTDTKTALVFGNVNYTTTGKLATSAKTASMAGEVGDQYYTAVLPTAGEGNPLTLRMNYTLVSDDGSNEEIKVYGAKAVIPASYTQWQPNFAYTYIFKISDNTNGATGTGDKDPEGLFPITFDAVVADIDNVDFNQETITTVSTPSVTTYAFDNKEKKVIQAYDNGKDNEYPAATTTDIYVSVTATKVSDDGTIKVGDPMTNLNDKGKLYTIDTKHANATEAEVIDALQVQSSSTTTSITGRNGVELTQVGENTVSYPETIPSADNKTIDVTKNSVAKFSATATATTYAYVYKEKDGKEPTYITTAVVGDDKITAHKDEYYTDYDCTKVVTENTKLENGVIYYKKYTNNNNSYAVKVIKTFVTPKP